MPLHSLALYRSIAFANKYSTYSTGTVRVYVIQWFNVATCSTHAEYVE